MHLKGAVSLSLLDLIETGLPPEQRGGWSVKWTFQYT